MCEKDVRFQEQVQKHEEELLRVTTQSQSDSELQQVQEARTTSNNRLPVRGFHNLTSAVSQLVLFLLLLSKVSTLKSKYFYLRKWNQRG